MVKSYLDFTNDTEYAIDCIDDLAKEFIFFEKHHTVTVNEHTLFRYIESSSGPRPESYREDYTHAQAFETEEEKEDFYSEIKAGAESGMDFTARWFIAEDGTNKGKFLSTAFFAEQNIIM